MKGAASTFVAALFPPATKCKVRRGLAKIAGRSIFGFSTGFWTPCGFDMGESDSTPFGLRRPLFPVTEILAFLDAWR